MTCASLFSNAGQGALYSLHRPKYPQALYEAILANCSSARSLAVDIATGSGQAASALAEHFERVEAQDGSAEQLKHADRQHPNVHYQHADAHDTGLPAQSADLVTVAQALHWFDLPRFYREVRRILKPSGCFAAWTYGLPVLHSQEHPANAVLWQLYDGVLGPYWAAGRRHVEDTYATVQPVQGQDFGRVQLLQKAFAATRRAKVDDVVGLVSSWSAYHTYREKHPDRDDPLPAFKQHLLAALGAHDGSYELDVTHHMTLLIATEPAPV